MPFLIVERKRRFHGFRARKRAVAVDVGINICGGAHIRMSQPILNHFHGYLFGEQHGCARVAQVVKTNFFESVLFEDDMEVRSDVLRCENIAQGVRADIILVLFMVAPAETSFHFLLMRFLGAQNFADMWD